MQGAWCEL
jgi:hypothetical protein